MSKGMVGLKIVQYTNRSGTVAAFGWRAGAWRFAVDTNLPPSEASRSVYHEMAHILQAQRLGGLDTFDARVDEEMRAAGLAGRSHRTVFRYSAYENMPLEVKPRSSPSASKTSCRSRTSGCDRIADPV